MSNSSCPNCGATLSCGCQRRQATNGAGACSNCVAALNAKIAATKVVTPQAQPTVWGANRYKK